MGSPFATAWCSRRSSACFRACRVAGGSGASGIFEEADKGIVLGARGAIELPAGFARVWAKIVPTAETDGLRPNYLS
jgi:hypothetical protein